MNYIKSGIQVRLKRLIKDLKDLEIKGSKEIEITGICAHSKYVSPGNLFVAKKGHNTDGARFISDAIEAGASCILTDLHDPFLKVTQIIHNDVASIEAKLAATYFQNPSKSLKVIGITGTNGKTTTALIIKHLLEKAGMKCGYIGTFGAMIKDQHFPLDLTTPDVITSHKLLREMVDHKCEVAIMEVSSHALDQGRVGEIGFDIALFTNLTQDHLDYHKTMEDYKKAKQKLFFHLDEQAVAIFNKDDPLAVTFAKVTEAKTMTYGIEAKADLTAQDVKITNKGLQFKVDNHLIKSPLIGKFNVYNLLGALVVGKCLSIPIQQSASYLKNFKSAKGRLDPIKNKLGLQIFIDYAHTEDALRNVLETLQAIKKGKIITVFGCGGGRDKDKRKKMGKVVSNLSDRAFVTSDNPRNEDPTAIANEILKGFSKEKTAYVELDREKAIEAAINLAEKDDIILIAGKGHETSQIFAHQSTHFSDEEVAKKIIDEKEKAS